MFLGDQALRVALPCRGGGLLTETLVISVERMGSLMSGWGLVVSLASWCVSAGWFILVGLGAVFACVPTALIWLDRWVGKGQVRDG